MIAGTSILALRRDGRTSRALGMQGPLIASRPLVHEGARRIDG
jgi:hypothetical protein